MSGGQGALTGQRLLEALETAEKPFTPSHVSEVQVIHTFPTCISRTL